MELIRFFARAPRSKLLYILSLAAISGVANALLIIVVNQIAANLALDQTPTMGQTGFYIGAFVIYFFANAQSLILANRVIEELLHRMRIDLMDKLRQVELKTIHEIKEKNLYSMVAQETNSLSVAFPIFVDSFRLLVMLGVSLIFLSYLSLSAFFVFMASALLGYWLYRGINVGFVQALVNLSERREIILGVLRDIVCGFKELRLNSRKNATALVALRTSQKEMEVSMSDVGHHWAAVILLISIVTFVALGLTVLILPQYQTLDGITMLQLVPMLLFCFGPLGKLFAQSPVLLQADTGLARIHALEETLEKASLASTAQAREQARFGDFTAITYQQLNYVYQSGANETLFSLGPIDVEIARGKVLFITGDNGSGKSTLLRLMTGLFPPDGGQILVDGAEVEGKALAGFRELFSAIFADFHLFERLYGLGEVDPAALDALLAETQLAGKVRYNDGRFEYGELSTGQRKRLALVVALLEDRPVYMFDEWPAEQDASFREYFYNVILSRLRAQNKAVVLVTHDDRYWRLADNVLRLD